MGKVAERRTDEEDPVHHRHHPVQILMINLKVNLGIPVPEPVEVLEGTTARAMIPGQVINDEVVVEAEIEIVKAVKVTGLVKNRTDIQANLKKVIERNVRDRDPLRPVLQIPIPIHVHLPPHQNLKFLVILQVYLQNHLISPACKLKLRKN